MSGTGVDLRMHILAEAVDQQLLKPLRTHGWNASIGETSEAGEYVIVVASKAGAEHKVALLYTSATANAHYKHLSSIVEHIFTNGALYRIEQYAYGISTPVTPVEDFFPLLVQWNKAVSPDAPQAIRTPRKLTIRHITSENPIDGIWARIDQFASIHLAEKLIRRRAAEDSVSLEPERIRTKAAGLAYSLQNASDYFRNSPAESLNKRILSLYYGVLALAFAEMLASPSGPTDLDEVEGMTKQGHGLYTVPSVTGDFAGTNVGVLATGFFPRWVSFLGHDTSAFPKAKPKTPSDVDKFAAGTVATFEALLAAIPELGDIFREVFDSAPAWVVPVFQFEENPGYVKLRAANQVEHRESAYIHLLDSSQRIPVARISATKWPIAEVSKLPDGAENPGFRVRVDHAGCDYWHEVLPIHRSPFDDRPTLILPVLASVSEYRAIAMSVLYALSIMVRYMPSCWRRVEGGDWDQYLATVKTAVRVFERVLPEEFLQSIIGEKIHASQPGSLS